MKTYSLCVLVSDKNNLNKGKPYWVTNWYENQSMNDFDWDKVESFCIENGNLAYGYIYGNDSRKLKSNKNRTILKILNI